MALLRLQVSHYKLEEPVRHWCTNTFYLDVGFDLSIPEPDIFNPDAQALAVDTAALWGSYRPLPSGWNRVTCRVYNMADATPRRPIGDATYDSGANTSGAAGPRECALCLSFSTDANRKRERGRLYIGPWMKTQLDERPDVAQRAALGTLAQGIQDLGGANVDWQIWSSLGAPGGIAHKVDKWWVDDEWDTQRRRGLDPTLRLTGVTDE